jgi:hypothetical protein
MEDRVETIKRLNIEHYIARLNIDHYKKLLETDIDETKRKIVMRLLAKEQANLLELISKGQTGAHAYTNLRAGYIQPQALSNWSADITNG